MSRRARRGGRLKGVRGIFDWRLGEFSADWAKSRKEVFPLVRKPRSFGH